jgi:hypothetical protein
MLDVAQPQYEMPEAPALVRANQAGARGSFEQFRVMIDPTIINSWWQRHAAWLVRDGSRIQVTIECNCEYSAMLVYDQAIDYLQEGELVLGMKTHPMRRT